MIYDAAVIPCEEYDPQEVRSALIAATDAVGGLGWVKPGMKIAVKCNLVSMMKPSAAATVHPVVATELCRLFTERGARVILGDSPGGPWNAPWVNSIYTGTGIREVESAGAELNADFSQETVSFPDGVRVKSFPFTGWLNKCDWVVDLCKLKTHALTGFTCAVKNFFGAIPGTRKPEFHYMNPQLEDFCNMLVDLNEYIKPRLTIVDAIMCMEGNGPTMGTPRHLGGIIAAGTPYSADLLGAYLIGIEPENAPTIKAAAARGLCPESVDKLNIFGDAEALRKPDFEKLPVREDIKFRERLPFINKFLSTAFGSGPRVNKDLCVGCGKCAEVCPRETVHVVKGKAKITAKNCIRCFCCQEFCPKGAISVHRPVLARLLGKKG